MMTPMMTPAMMMLMTMVTVATEQFLKLAPLLVRASFACACAYWYSKKKEDKKKRREISFVASFLGLGLGPNQSSQCPSLTILEASHWQRWPVLLKMELTSSFNQHTPIP